MAGEIELLRKGFAALEKHVVKRKAAIEDRLKKERVDDYDTTHRWRFIQHAIDNYDKDIDQLQGLSLAAVAWNETSTQPSPAIPISSLLSPVRKAEQQLSDRLDGLEEFRVLQRITRMAITALVHPENERNSEQATVEDIFDASASDTAGGDDGFDDDADPIVVTPFKMQPRHCRASWPHSATHTHTTFGHQIQLKATNSEESFLRWPGQCLANSGGANVVKWRGGASGSEWPRHRIIEAILDDSSDIVGGRNKSKKNRRQKCMVTGDLRQYRWRKVLWLNFKRVGASASRPYPNKFPKSMKESAKIRVGGKEAVQQFVVRAVEGGVPWILVISMAGVPAQREIGDVKIPEEF
ncbi:hypothetical protein DFH08DRAFT_815894 [Mycena albidolilacea]|uniref:Uncharacterized protein n=1 Tax=Mycena albidolilacea TaxID=1033008 RepID=A0AAD6ZM61_9AGAR|nr:hypothetical protein DFH08DRAFT_815894 [Mycena albidolilacea]